MIEGIGASKALVMVVFAIIAVGAAGTYVYVSHNNGESGSGNEEGTIPGDVVWIHNVWELQNMSKNLSGHYALANDIDASITRNWNDGAGFIPIGDEITPFSGTFYGRGHRITNLWINRPSEDYAALFGYTTESAVIENVGLLNVNVRGYADVGGLVGASSYGSTIENCYATGNVYGNEFAGGLVGSNGGTIQNCYATGNVSATGNWESGIGYFAGGLVGSNSGTLKKSYATGNVQGYCCVGGLVGQNTGTIQETYAIGSVSGNSNVGGLVGENYFDSTIDNSYATGNVHGNDTVGGLAGTNGGTIQNCYATGSVEVKGHCCVGGLVGVSETDLSGGSVPIVTASFWDVNTSGVDHSADGTGLATEEMKIKSTFLDAGWDFENIWDIRDGDSYPFLKWQNGNNIPRS